MITTLDGAREGKLHVILCTSAAYAAVHTRQVTISVEEKEAEKVTIMTCEEKAKVHKQGKAKTKTAKQEKGPGSARERAGPRGVVTLGYPQRKRVTEIPT